MQEIHISKEILSFCKVIEKAKHSQRTVLLLRHSIRESIAGKDPSCSSEQHLTKEGIDLALHCGSLLSGLPGTTSFAATPTVRTVETAKYLMEGGKFPEGPIQNNTAFCDRALFEDFSIPAKALRENRILGLLEEYLSTGNTAGAYPLDIVTEHMTNYLQTNEFTSRNTIIISHDVVIVAFLTGLHVYSFTMNDWCGYLQGAAFFQDENGEYTVHYITPENENREKFKVFV